MAKNHLLITSNARFRRWLRALPTSTASPIAPRTSSALSASRPNKPRRAAVKPQMGLGVSMSPVEAYTKEEVETWKDMSQIDNDITWYSLSVTTTPTVVTIDKPQGDPDGPLVPLPTAKCANPVPYSAPQNDYIAALYRPYVSPI